MHDPDEPVAFGSIRGLVAGKKPDQPLFFHFRATLRIHGEGVPFSEISERLGVEPTHCHRKGDRRTPSSKSYPTDMWHFESSLPATDPLERHIEVLWNVVRPHVDYLKSLKSRFTLDVFCGYRSNCDCAGFEVSHKALELFTALEIPFGASVIIA